MSNILGPEYKLKTHKRQEVSSFLEEECKSLTQSLTTNKISTSVAKAILLRHQWDQNEAKQAIKAKKYILCDKVIKLMAYKLCFSKS